MEGLNDEMSMQLMVATFNHYQELVNKALMIEGKQQQIESRKKVWTRKEQLRSSTEASSNPELLVVQEIQRRRSSLVGKSAQTSAECTK